MYSNILYCSIFFVIILNEHIKCEQCEGYQSCPTIKEGYVNVHIVPHSHLEVGWMKTLDQYYYGARSQVEMAGVQYVYDTVLSALKRRKDRKFVFAETAFFWKWWTEQDETVKNEFTTLVTDGRIQFVGGGWSMNDEAVTNYQSIVDQMTWGLRRLNDTFGTCGVPKVAWQIDSYGHSSEMASILAGLGFDGVFLGRVDFQDKAKRLADGDLEIIWRGSSSLGTRSDIFTGILYDHYTAPPGFCFDINCNDEPVIDNPKSAEYNLETKALNLTRYINRYSRGGNMLLPMGGQFSYQDAETWFKSMDKLIKYINNGTRYNLFYSTPSCYLKAVHTASKGRLTTQVKTDDFFPYAKERDLYWTGFYTSKPTLKRFERIGNNFLQVCKQLSALTGVHSENLNALREAMGVLQHHDAITGTARSAATQDYARQLHKGVAKCEEVANEALSILTHAEESSFKSCLLSNISQCVYSEIQNELVVTVYNPLSRPITKYVRLPISDQLFVVKDPSGNELVTQTVPIPKRVLNVPGRQSTATRELVFVAVDVPPLGFKSFFLEQGFYQINDQSDEFSDRLGSDDVGVKIDPKSGLVVGVEMNGVNLDLNQTILHYNGSNGFDYAELSRTSGASGAYIFRPDPRNPLATITDHTNFTVHRGDLVSEIHQEFNEWISQVVRVYNTEHFVEFEWLVGPIPTDTPYGKEVISRFSTDLDTSMTFYTDSNGREMVRRVRDFRPTWKFRSNETIASNYYPVTSKILVRDLERDIEMAVLTDRGQGGSSLRDGQLELMMHRNAVMDDGCGVKEVLIEKAFGTGVVARGSHYLVLGRTTKPTDESGISIAALEREISERKLLDSWVFISSPNGQTFEDYQTNHIMEFQGLSYPLPPNVHVLTLEPWKDSSFLLRLEHIFPIDEDPALSKPVTVDIQGLFSTFDIVSIKETTLGANQWIDENKPLKFRSVAEEPRKELSDDVKGSFRVTLNPMQIRTFVIEVQFDPRL